MIAFFLGDDRSDVLHREANLETGEIASFLGKQLQGKRLKPTSKTYFEVLTLARRCVGFLSETHLWKSSFGAAILVYSFQHSRRLTAKLDFIW
jgi:hypothetical protein